MFKLRSTLALKGLVISGLLLILTIGIAFTIKITEQDTWATHHHHYGSFDYPSHWEVITRDMNSPEIPVHIELRDSKSGTYGFVQLWQVEGGLDTLIQPPPVKNPGFSNVKISKTALATRSIYLLNYSLKGDVTRQAKEIVFQQGPFTYRLMLSNSDWTPKIEQQFMQIGKSLKISKT